MMSIYNDHEITDVEVEIGNGIKGTLCIPKLSNCKNNVQIPRSKKVALILHGQGGHRNYCYQKSLAHNLASELGVYSLRIDFRGCGDSADNEDEAKGRVIQQDVEDIQQCAEFLTNGKSNPLGIGLFLSAIIGHSRGSTAMFLWALKQDKIYKSASPFSAIVVPNLINCSSRFRMHTIYERFENFEGAPISALRYGKFQPVMVTKDEIDSLADVKLDQLSDLSREFSVMSIYGLHDHIIPVDDFKYFANSLNRGDGTHKLEVIPMADHNFYGKSKEPDIDEDQFNPEGYPTTTKGLINYNPKVVELIVDFLQPKLELSRFLSLNRSVESVPRWRSVEGINNFRDIGGWKISRQTVEPKDLDFTKLCVKRNVIFRSASTSEVTSAGLEKLKKMNVKVIFDLRADTECIRDGYPTDLETYGIERVHIPVYNELDLSPQEIISRYVNLLKSWSTFVHVYDEMLENGTACFKYIFEYIEKMEPDSAILFHCTAGKDRTGVMTMLILSLMGVDSHTIAKEYELTTVGLIPSHNSIRSKFNAKFMKEKSKNHFKSITTIFSDLPPGWSIEEDGFNNLISSRYEAMLDTINLLNTKYGGILNYMENYLHISQQSIRNIYLRLLDTNSLPEDTYITHSAFPETKL